MGSLFGSRLSERDKTDALALIFHLQAMSAYQQLSMETYNDALARAAGLGTPTNEGGFARPTAGLSDPQSVRLHVIPALERKIEILSTIEARHSAFGLPTSGRLRRVYDDYSAALDVMIRRGQLQLASFRAWVADPTVTADMTRLDRAENAAITKSATSLNALVRKAGLSTDEWLEINREAFNEIRASQGLVPLSKESFQGTYFGGLAGQPARFFS